MISQEQLSKQLKDEAFQQGFDPVGIARIPGSQRLRLRTAALQRWLKAGNQADMGWMASPRRQDITQNLEGINSLLAVGLNYFVDTNKDKQKLSIARYGWGRDYHKVVKQRLRRIGRWLEQKRPQCHWKICVDSSPLLDKAWAEEAGLGWIGKHSNLINQNKGSWLVIGHLLCTEVLTPDKPSPSLCGKCQKCLDACPTKAITEPFVVDSRRCIAYHTIENRNLFLPKEITNSMGNWVAGCDICQDVCPWNNKGLKSTDDPEMQPKEWILELTKMQALAWDEETWNKKLRGSALKRIKPWMWKRNVSASEETNKKTLK